MRMWGYRPLNMGCIWDGLFGERLLMGLFWRLSLFFFLSDLATILVLQAGSERAPHALRFLGNWVWSPDVVPSLPETLSSSLQWVSTDPNPWSCSQRCPWFPHPCPLCHNTYFFLCCDWLQPQAPPSECWGNSMYAPGSCLHFLLAPTCRANLLEGFFTMSGIPWWVTGSFVILAQELKLSPAFINTQNSIFWLTWVNSG